MENKLFIRIIIMAGLALICSGFPTAFGASYVIGLSPYYDAADRETVLRQIFLLMLQDVSTGDDITVCDALNRQVVSRFSIPEGSLFQDNAQAHARRLAPSIVAVKNFVLTERAHSPDMTGVIRLPEFLDLVGSQLRVPGQTLRVILVGSPFYFTDDNAFDERDAFPLDRSTAPSSCQPIGRLRCPPQSSHQLPSQ